MNPFEGYKVTSPFGWRNSPFDPNTKEFHTGVDLVKPFQEPIYSFTTGRVVFSGTGTSGTGFGGYGNVVAIKDEDGCLLCYCHLHNCVVKVGTRVEKGQMIGRLGSTGRSTGPHLHFEVRKHSQDGVPYGWIADRANNCYEPTKYLQDHYEKYYKPVKQQPAGKYPISEEDINKVIAILGDNWTAAQDKTKRDEFHRLADELRKLL